MLLVWQDVNPFWPHIFSFQGSIQDKRMQCAAVKKRGSAEPCTAKAMRAHTLCGRHARMRDPILWVAANIPRAGGLPKLQAYVRGWIVRKRMALAGPGVLSRKNLVNDEELVSCVEKDKQHPLEYFAFEENGKIWWFAFSSIWLWSLQSTTVTNPYTKEPLSVDTRKRLRALWAFQHRHREPLPEESNVVEQRLRGRLTTMCQLFSDYGFVEVNPNVFMEFGKSEWASAFRLLARDIETVFSVNDPFRDKALRLCERGHNGAHHMPDTMYPIYAAFLMKWLLSLHKDPYVMSFSVLSALYRC